MKREDMADHSVIYGGRCGLGHEVAAEANLAPFFKKSSAPDTYADCRRHCMACPSLSLLQQEGNALCLHVYCDRLYPQMQAMMIVTMSISIIAFAFLVLPADGWRNVLPAIFICVLFAGASAFLAWKAYWYRQERDGAAAYCRMKGWKIGDR